MPNIEDKIKKLALTIARSNTVLSYREISNETNLSVNDIDSYWDVANEIALKSLERSEQHNGNKNYKDIEYEINFHTFQYIQAKAKKEDLTLISDIKKIFPEFSPDLKEDLIYNIIPPNGKDVYKQIILHPISNEHNDILPQNSFNIKHYTAWPSNIALVPNSERIIDEFTFSIENDKINAYWMQDGKIYKDALRKTDDKFYATPDDIKLDMIAFMRKISRNVIINIKGAPYMQNNNYELDKEPLMTKLVKAGIKAEEMGHHESDLYVEVNNISTSIINNYEYKSNVSTFKSQIDGKMNYEIPFAYVPEFDKRLHAGPIPTAPGLPKICYAKREETGEAILLVRGEKGYKPAGYIVDVEAENKSLGVTKAQEEAMLIGSMFGWNVPGADPKTHETQTYAVFTVFDKNNQLYDAFIDAGSGKKMAQMYEEFGFTIKTDRKTDNPETYGIPKDETVERRRFMLTMEKNYPNQLSGEKLSDIEKMETLCQVAHNMSEQAQKHNSNKLSTEAFNRYADAHEKTVEGIVKGLPGTRAELDFEKGKLQLHTKDTTIAVPAILPLSQTQEAAPVQQQKQGRKR